MLFHISGVNYILLLIWGVYLIIHFNKFTDKRIFKMQNVLGIVNLQDILDRNVEGRNR